MAIDVSSLNKLINEFRALSKKDSISPETVGFLLQKILDLFLNVADDDSLHEISDELWEQMASLQTQLTAGDGITLNGAAISINNTISRVKQLNDEIKERQTADDALAKKIDGKQDKITLAGGLMMEGNAIGVDSSVARMDDISTLDGYITSEAVQRKQKDDQLSQQMLQRTTFDDVNSLIAKAKEALFKDMWNLACNAQCYGVRNQEQYYIGRFNEETGFYECNGITDLTYEEALMIYNTRRPLQADMTRAYAYISNSRMGAKLRTNLFTNTISPYSITTNITYVAYYCQDMEVLRLGYPEWTTQVLTLSASTSAMFTSSKSLKKIIGVIDMGNFTTTTTLYPFGTASDNGVNATKAIEEFQFANIQCNISMVNQPNITCESILFMIEKRKGSNPITWQVHGDVYNRCLDYEVEGYNNLQDYALDKNITIGTV